MNHLPGVAEIEGAVEDDLHGAVAVQIDDARDHVLPQRTRFAGVLQRDVRHDLEHVGILLRAGAQQHQRIFALARGFPERLHGIDERFVPPVAVEVRAHDLPDRDPVRLQAQFLEVGRDHAFGVGPASLGQVDPRGHRAADVVALAEHGHLVFPDLPRAEAEFLLEGAFATAVAERLLARTADRHHLVADPRQVDQGVGLVVGHEGRDDAGIDEFAVEAAAEHAGQAFRRDGDGRPEPLAGLAFRGGLGQQGTGGE